MKIGQQADSTEILCLAPLLHSAGVANRALARESGLTALACGRATSRTCKGRHTTSSEGRSWRCTCLS